MTSAGTLVIDAIKYLNADPERDHLVEALELNEFICYMYPSMRPHNKSLLFHVVSDLLGLLLYGMPKKRLSVIESLEVIDYSGRNTFYPVLRVWERLKTRIGAKNTLKEDIVEGFINKIRVEMYVVDRYPFVDDIFFSSRKQIEKWLPSLSGFYRGQAPRSWRPMKSGGGCGSVRRKRRRSSKAWWRGSSFKPKGTSASTSTRKR